MNVVVTGASNGIGAEIVKELVKNGVKKIYAISRNRNKLDQLREVCKSIGDTEVIVFPLDLCELDTLDVNTTINNEKIDVLINNAGYLVKGDFRKLRITDVEAMYRTNVLGPFQLIQQLINNLKQSSIAHIVNIGSMGGVQGSLKFSGLSAYSSSKAAIAGLSECLAEELKEDGIKVNCLAIGAVNTEMLNKAFPDFKANLSSQQMAQYIVHFALHNHVYFNGKIVQVANSTP